MFFLKMAWKNIGRNVRRTVITLVVITFCCILMMVMFSLVLGFHKGIVKNSVKSGTGHIQIHKSGFHSRVTPEYYLKQEQALKDTLDKQKDIENYALRVKGLGIVTYTSKAQNVTIIGIQPTNEPKVSLFHKKATATSKGPLIAGEYLKEDDWKQGYPNNDPTKRYRLPGILIGYKIAEKFKIKVGSKLVITLQSLSGEIKQNLVRVRGIFKALNPAYDRGTVFIHYRTAQELFDYSEKNYFSEVVILAKDYQHMTPIAKSLKQELTDGDYEILTWDEIHPSTVGFMKIQKVFMSIFTGILLAITAVGIIITVLTSIFERMREFGVMRSLGMSNLKLTRLIVTESLLMGGISCIIGTFIGLFICYHLQTTGIDLTKVAEASSVIPISLDATVYGDIRAGSFLLCYTLILLVSAIISLYPARKATTIKIVDALTYV